MTGPDPERTTGAANAPIAAGYKLDVVAVAVPVSLIFPRMKMRGRVGYVVALAERTDELLSGGQLLALVDTLRNGTSDAN